MDNLSVLFSPVNYADPKPSQSPKPEPKQPKDSKSEDKPVDPNELSEDEQMALYEKDLKDSDWGHQPC